MTQKLGASSGFAGALKNNGSTLESQRSQQLTVVEISEDTVAPIVSFSIPAPADAKIITDFVNVSRGYTEKLMNLLFY